MMVLLRKKKQQRRKSRMLKPRKARPVHPKRTHPFQEWTIFNKRGNGGIMADVCLLLARPYVFCVVFLYSRTAKEARLRFSDTALPK